MKFSVSVNSICQVLAILIQFGIQYEDLLPPKYKWLVVGIVTTLQGISAIAAHFKKPDGTPIKADEK